MKMHWCTATVNLSGQGFHIVNYNQFEPLSWPEIQVISALHGEENVYDVKPIRVSETSPRQEKERLVAKYKYDVCQAVFPGRVFRMEMLMPGHETDQPVADDYGVAVSEDVEPANSGEEEAPQEPPTGAPVFKPGKHRPIVSP